MIIFDTLKNDIYVDRSLCTSIYRDYSKTTYRSYSKTPCLLQEADLTEANLRGADLEGAENLTIEQLSLVKTLYKATGLDPDLMKEIKEKYPRLLEKP
ncbi:pentapeptide repeat-containing protein [Acidobacteriota bacterium]